MNFQPGMIKTIEAAAKDVLAWPMHRQWSANRKKNVFRSLFGCLPTIVAELWQRILNIDGADEEKTAEQMKATHKHLLYALCFLKVYGVNEMVRCSIMNWPDEEMFRKYSWFFIKKVWYLQDSLIIFDDRFAGQDQDLDNISQQCMMSVDCLDCAVREPGTRMSQWDLGMYSKKHNGPVFKYEVGVCIKTGFMVWVNGPYKARTHDLPLFKDELEKRLLPWELVEGDKRYRGNIKVRCPDVGINTQERRDKMVVRARHEAVNGRLREFNVISCIFHHATGGYEDMKNKHAYCFGAVATITQLKLLRGETNTCLVGK